MGGTIRVGIVSEVDPNTVRVRVTFDDLDSDDNNGLLSGWLAVLQHGSTADQGYWLPNVGSQVVCITQSNSAEVGYVAGTIYSTEDTPSKAGDGIWYQRFEDGTVIEYDPASGVTISSPLTVKIVGSQVQINP